MHTYMRLCVLYVWACRFWCRVIVACMLGDFFLSSPCVVEPATHAHAYSTSVAKPDDASSQRVTMMLPPSPPYARNYSISLTNGAASKCLLCTATLCTYIRTYAQYTFCRLAMYSIQCDVFAVGLALALSDVNYHMIANWSATAKLPLASGCMWQCSRSIDDSCEKIIG